MTKASISQFFRLSHYVHPGTSAIAPGIPRNVVIRNSVTGEAEVRPINEIASCHMACQTFVGNLFKKFKDQSLISELSGHVPNSREFARYREIDSELKREMVSVIE